jgi:GNAT superfamily N-acetyltransferase
MFLKFGATPALRAGQLRHLNGGRPPAGTRRSSRSTRERARASAWPASSSLPMTPVVELAVIDDWHGRTLGTALLHDLAARAREEGVEGFSALVLAEDEPILELLRSIGDVHLTGRAHRVVELLMDLPHGGIPEPLGHTVRAAARGDIQLDAGHPAAS